MGFVPKKTLVTVAFWLILPNLFFLSTALALSIDRATVNIDYLLAGVFFSAGRKYIGTALLSIFLLLELLALTGLLFPFVRLQDVSYLLGLLPHAAGLWQVTFAIIITLVILAVYAAHKYAHRGDFATTLVLLNIGLVIYGSSNHLNAGVNEDRWYRTSKKFASSQSVFFFNTRTTGFHESFKNDEAPLIETGFNGKTAVWAQAKNGELSNKLLLVVAESWGVMSDEKINRKLIEPLTQLHNNLVWISSGQMEAEGATIGAELRELCGTETRHYNLKDVSEGFSGCLPQRLKEFGYTTTAVHGAVGVMYDRIHWYPKAGFDQLVFKESLNWKSQCYSFPGVCDWEIGERYISSAFDSHDKSFVYWLTLNSHSIYDKRDIKQPLFDCAEYLLPENSETCRMLNLHAQFFHDFANTIRTGGLSGVEVIIVGDHPPRMIDKSQLEHIQQGLVSWAHFKVVNR